MPPQRSASKVTKHFRLDVVEKSLQRSILFMEDAIVEITDSIDSWPKRAGIRWTHRLAAMDGLGLNLFSGIR